MREKVRTAFYQDRVDSSVAGGSEWAELVVERSVKMLLRQSMWAEIKDEGLK